MTYAVLILMTMMGAFAGLFLKKASSSEGLKKLLGNIYFYLGGGLYFISALLNIYILRKLDYSIVLPLTSITYIWTMALSYFVLAEKISVKKIVGVCCIIVGAVFIAVF